MTLRLLSPDTALLLVVDMQERLLAAMPDPQGLCARMALLLEGMGALGVPVAVSEQYPRGLGPTTAVLKAALPDNTIVLEKTAFGCLGEPAISAHLAGMGRQQVVVCGIEAHVCVSQTVHQLLAAGYEPHVVADVTASRAAESRRVALDKMRQSGAVPATVESVLFELMGDARHPAFKALQTRIRDMAPEL